MEIPVQFDLECDVCAADLEGTYSEVRGRQVLNVTPCARCIAEAKQDGIAEAEAGADL